LTYDYGLWTLVVVHVVGLLGFALAFLRPARPREWRSMGIFTGFVVALYVEMYGFPLTIFLLTALVGGVPTPEPFAHVNGNLWATLVLGRSMAGPLMLVGGLLMVAGGLVLARAWTRVYRARGALVTDGPYARVRHPQYSALFLVIGGALVQWPTVLTLLMAPVLVVAYLRLAWREERELEAQFGEAYRSYRQHVPGFLPAVPLRGAGSGAASRTSTGSDGDCEVRTALEAKAGKGE
jgi:protein-S-isoprenylcysteine O-methyltransferase Ste14